MPSADPIKISAAARVSRWLTRTPKDGLNKDISAYCGFSDNSIRKMQDYSANPLSPPTHHWPTIGAVLTVVLYDCSAPGAIIRALLPFHSGLPGAKVSSEPTAITERILGEWSPPGRLSMKRRAFLKNTVTGMSLLADLPAADTPSYSAFELPATAADLILPPDGYEPPAWLRYSRTIYFDGTSPPIYPHLDEFDAERLVKVSVELGGDTLRFQPVGYWATYPTSSKYPIHPELGGRDLIAEVSRACRKAGLHLYCYTKYNNPFLSRTFVDEHPEYLDRVVRGPDGKPSGIFDNLGWIMSPKADATGDVYRQAVHQIVKEYCTYDIDGAYFDGPSDFSYTEVCYCATCRKKFKQYCGMDIDRLQNRDDMEARIAWYQWFQQMELADLLEFRKVLHASGKFMLCHNGDAWEGESLHEQYRIPDGFMAEHEVQIYRRLMTGMLDVAMARPTRKLAQMYMGSYCLSDFHQPPQNHPWSLENTSEEDGDEVLMEGMTNLACGAAPIYATLNRLYFGLGGGSSRPAQEVYEVMRRAEPFLQDSVAVPYVTLVPTWEALQLWRTDAGSGIWT